MRDESMKKWISYKSLIEQEQEINKLKINKHKIEKPILFDDKIEEINNFLTNYDNSQITLQYYNNGYLYNVTCYIKKIDILNKYLVLDDDTKIKFEDIIDIIY